jgi:hypothetical protein
MVQTTLRSALTRALGMAFGTVFLKRIQTWNCRHPSMAASVDRIKLSKSLFAPCAPVDSAPVAFRTRA